MKELIEYLYDSLVGRQDVLNEHFDDQIDQRKTDEMTYKDVLWAFYDQHLADGGQEMAHIDTYLQWSRIHYEWEYEL